MGSWAGEHPVFFLSVPADAGASFTASMAVQNLLSQPDQYSAACF
jgi:hypothetical protein